MSRLFSSLLVLFVCLAGLHAQTSIGLVAYYPFDGSLTDATGTTANAGQGVGSFGYACGIEQDALIFNGVNNFVRISGPVTGEFDTEDFSLSFYMKATGLDGTQYLVSKRDSSCTNDRVFYIRYAPASRTLNVVLSENASKNVSFSLVLDEGRCWYHIALVRRGNRVRLYIDGEQEQELGTISRIDLDNAGDLLIGNSLCRGPNETFFRGFIDDFRVYNLALEDDEVRGLFVAPDRIQNPNSQIFLGESVDIALTPTCGTDFSWTPAGDVFGPADAEPRITPSEAGVQVFRIDIEDGSSTCIATDTIRLTVIDPDDLDCNALFFPTAFTPNGSGPQRNETFGISNPFAVEELISFEIYDRWGGKVFSTRDPFERWDGTFQGEPMNTNVVVYKVEYLCEGEAQSQIGTVAIIR